MKYYRVEFGGLDNWLWLNNANIPETQARWTQQPDHWSLFFLEHSGGFSINNRTYPYEDGYVALVGPGTKAGFLRTGAETPCYCLTFGIVKRIEVVALPSLVDVGELKEVRRAEFQDATKWLSKSIGRGLALAYNLLWSVAQPAEVLRSSSYMYDLEQLVAERLSHKLSVEELAAELEMSQSQLLRLVRSEYGQTVQEFIREKRAEVARTLIVSTEMPLKEIAARTGMADLQYFNKVVRSAAGLSPRALRELATNRTRH